LVGGAVYECSPIDREELEKSYWFSKKKGEWRTQRPPLSQINRAARRTFARIRRDKKRLKSLDNIATWKRLEKTKKEGVNIFQSHSRKTEREGTKGQPL